MLAGVGGGGEIDRNFFPDVQIFFQTYHNFSEHIKIFPNIQTFFPKYRNFSFAHHKNNFPINPKTILPSLADICRICDEWGDVTLPTLHSSYAPEQKGSSAL